MFIFRLTDLTHKELICHQLDSTKQYWKKVSQNHDFFPLENVPDMIVLHCQRRLGGDGERFDAKS